MKSIEEIERREQIRQRFVAASYPRPTTWDPLTFASSDPADVTHDANTARTRALEQEQRRLEAEADAERRRPTEIDATNLPMTITRASTAQLAWHESFHAASLCSPG